MEDSRGELVLIRRVWQVIAILIVGSIALSFFFSTIGSFLPYVIGTGIAIVVILIIMMFVNMYMRRRRRW